MTGQDHDQGNCWWLEGTAVTRSTEPPLCFPLAGGSSAGREQRDNLLLLVDVSVAVPGGREPCRAGVLHQTALRKYDKIKAVPCSCPSPGTSPRQGHPRGRGTTAQGGRGRCAVVLLRDCWHNVSKHRWGSWGRDQGPLPGCGHRHQHCRHRRGPGLGQGHPGCMDVSARPVLSSRCRAGSVVLRRSAQLCRHRGVGAVLRGPPTACLVPQQMVAATRGYQGTGAHGWRGPWVHWIWGSLGVPMAPGPWCYRG